MDSSHFQTVSFGNKLISRHILNLAHSWGTWLKDNTMYMCVKPSPPSFLQTVTKSTLLSSFSLPLVQVHISSCLWHNGFFYSICFSHYFRMINVIFAPFILFLCEGFPNLWENAVQSLSSSSSFSSFFFLPLRFIFNYMYVCIFVRGNVLMNSGVCGGQERELHTLELNHQAVVCHHWGY